MSSEHATATKTLEQQIDQLVAQFKAQVHLLLLNQVNTNQVETKEKEVKEEIKKEETLSNPVVDSNGTKRWYNAQGQLHRDELDDQGEVLPALEQVNGYKEWYVNGQLHRADDKPAVISYNGDQHWYANHQRHRENDKPAVIYSNGDQEWWIKGNRHRADDKPAIIRSNGDQDQDQEWWIKGNRPPSRR